MTHHTDSGQGRKPRAPHPHDNEAWWYVLLAVAFIFLFVLIGTARAEKSPFTETESTVLYATDMALLTADYLQTRSIRPPYYETNAVLGKHPKQGQITAYFLAYGLGVTLLHFQMGNRALSDGLMIGIGLGEGYSVVHNASLGLRANWRF